MLERGPIFIGGLDRSGKTVLRWMLNQHPNLSITRKTYMWRHFYNRYGDLRQPENLERCLKALLRQKAIQALQPDLPRIRREFAEGQSTYPRLFALIHQHSAERFGKYRWGDQLGLVERFADIIFSAFPGARMIHMIRDPRDRYSATLAGLKPRRWRAGWATARWLYSARLAERNQCRFPDGYMVLRYERLIHDPYQALEEVCEFIGEDYSPRMLDRADHPDEEEEATFHPSQQILPGEIAFTQLIAGREMRRLGYQEESIKLSPRQAALYRLVDIPFNMAGMAYWRITEGREING